MIVYELPNGKCVYITVEQLLNLNHADIQNMIADGAGYSSNNPFRKLSSSKDEYNDTDDEKDNDSPDMLSDGDDDPFLDIDINQIPDS